MSNTSQFEITNIPLYNTLIRNYHRVNSCMNCYYCTTDSNVCIRDFSILSFDNLQAYKVDDKHMCDEWKER